MKTLAIVAMGLAMIAAPALAQSYTTTHNGDFSLTNGPNGYQGTGRQTGDWSQYSDNRGNHCTTRRVGNLVQTNCN
jgi:hypothetical protein